MIYIGIIILTIVLATVIFLNQPQFGTAPSGSRLAYIKQSPNYKDGQFQNLSMTPTLTEGASYSQVLNEFLFSKNKRRKPDTLVHSKKINLMTLSRDTDLFVWFGHSSYFMQIGGKRFLIDPVLSGSASPVKFTTRSFEGSDVYTPDEIPAIDYLLISHDHWDHLDYETLMKLKPKIGKIVTGLGVGAHLEHWGFNKQQIIEGDWFDTFQLDSGYSITLTPTRHFSGRLFKRNQTLWVSFVLNTPGMKIFMSGDGGYDSHFEKIGKLYGPFDLAILECGQYDKNWHYIHMLPNEVIKASLDLHVSYFIPVHWGKFQLANHDWDEPIKSITALSNHASLNLITPVIGDEVNLQNMLHHRIKNSNATVDALSQLIQ